MNNQVIFLAALFLSVGLIAYLIGRLHAKNGGQLPQDFLTIYNELQNLPAKILGVIQGSINPQKGKIAELLTYAEIRHDYDVIIPLGQPVDFIGVKNGVKIDFIEVKSGPQGALSAQEKEIEKLIRKGMVNFRLILINDSKINPVPKGENESFS